MTRVLRALVSKSVFVEESSRKIIDEEGKLDGDLLRYKILLRSIAKISRHRPIELMLSLTELESRSKPDSDTILLDGLLRLGWPH